MKKLVASIIAVLTVASLSAQEQNLNEEYKALKEKSETYNEYKVIKESRLDEFWSNVQSNEQELNVTINSLNDKIDQLNTEVETKEAARQKAENAMTELDYAATHITVLGIEFSKSAFKMFSGFTVLGLAIGLGFVFFLFKQTHSDSKKTAGLLNEVESEYQDYRQKSLDKYVKLKRDYQTAQNRLTELERVSSPRKAKMTV